jgi:hypothetical protein
MRTLATGPVTRSSNAPGLECNRRLMTVSLSAKSDLWNLEHNVDEVGA